MSEIRGVGFSSGSASARRLPWREAGRVLTALHSRAWEGKGVGPVLTLLIIFMVLVFLQGAGISGLVT